MINQHIQQLITTYKAELPSYHQEALSSFDWGSVAGEIAAKYRLSGRQSDLFIGEVVMLVFQITNPEVFKPNLMNHVGVSEASAHSMILDVKSRILDRLQAELERVVGDTPNIMQTELAKAGISMELAQDMATAAQTSGVYPSTGTINDTQTIDPYHENIE